MKIHEYQAKAILARYGVTTPRSEVAFTKEEAREGAHRLKSNVIVVKAQIHAGGRGKAGGVKPASNPDEAFLVANNMLGTMIKGIQVTSVLVVEAERRRLPLLRHGLPMGGNCVKRTNTFARDVAHAKRRTFSFFVL